MEFFREFHFKRLTFCVIFIICVGATCFLPWPTKLETEMPCAEVDADGQVLSEGSIHLQGWQLKYLFRDDVLILEPFSLPGNLSITTERITIRISDAVCSFGRVELPGDSVYSCLSIAIGKNPESYLLSLDGNRYFACSSEKTLTYSEIFRTYWFYVS